MITKSIKGAANRQRWAKQELARLGEQPGPPGRDRELEILRRKSENKRGTDMVDFWHVLIDYSTGERLKRVVMSRREACLRNRTLEGLGMGWGMVGE